MQFLDDVPLFMRLPRDQHPILAGACSLRNFEAGQVIIKQGDNGHEFFVIRSGEAEVLIVPPDGGPQQQVAILKSKDYFGRSRCCATSRGPPPSGPRRPSPRCGLRGRSSRSCACTRTCNSAAERPSQRARASGRSTRGLRRRSPAKKDSSSRRRCSRTRTCRP
mmetsp:Transcript_105004/g.327496  ORF Transcript_105004/g.327496 Transcript_105004/m.327496 type:complete len:164 (-) Transcript_105004:2027-2518(-)